MKRRKRKPAVKKRETTPTTWPERIFVTSCVLALAGLCMLFENDVVLPRCERSAMPGIVSNSQLSGKLAHTYRTFLIDVGDHEEHVLAKCTRNSCSGPYKILRQERIGTAAHAEFCGPFLTLLSLDQRLVYAKPPPAQADLDGSSNARRISGLVCFLYLAAVALYFTIRCMTKRPAPQP